MKNNPVIVYVGAASSRDALAQASGWNVLGATTFREALSQVIYSHPDLVILDAQHDMLVAEDTFFHLRTIQHPPILVLTNVPGRWETTGRHGRVALMPCTNTDEKMVAVRNMFSDPQPTI